MRCVIFTGKWFDAMDAFNKWAKGKALTNKVIIHTLNTHDITVSSDEARIAIVVYHPEGEPWEEAKHPIAEGIAAI